MGVQIHPPKRRRAIVWIVAAMAAAGALAVSASAGTILGSAKNDVLKGSPQADKLYGKAGNDRLYGYGGNDLLVGGPGADAIFCGAGRDVAIADAKDKVGKDCENVKGLPKATAPAPPAPVTPPPPPAPPLPPPPAPIRAGHYVGTTQQGTALEFDVLGDLSGIANLNFTADALCVEVPLTLRLSGIRVDLTPIAADRTFSRTFSLGQGDLTVTGGFRGQFDPAGGASGSLRVDLTLSNVPDVGTVHCSSGDVSWNAR